MQQPEVVGIAAIKRVKPLEAGKEGPPASCKVSATLKPQALNSSVVCGPANAVNEPLEHWGLADVSGLRSPHEGGTVGAPVHDHPCTHIHVLRPTVGANPGWTPEGLNGLQE